MNSLFTESKGSVENIEVIGTYDVVVCGGGIAGVAAALAAKRNGKSVIILEKGTMLGGLATMGLITWYLALCDGHGRKIISGIAEELLYKSIEYGYDTLPEEWRGGPTFVENPTGRYVTRFSPAEFVSAIEEMMINEGIDFSYDTLFTDAVMNDDGVCEAVIVEDLAGKKAYKGKVFIDATGDCDLAWRAGADTQTTTTDLSYWVYKTDFNLFQRAIESGKILDALDVHWYGNVPGAEDNIIKRIAVTDAKSVTEYIMRGRKIFLDDIKAKGKGNDHTALCIGSMPQVRMTRRIEGACVITPESVNKHADDSVGAICDWRKAGPLYEIPYGSLYSPKLKNIFACGRCISSDDDAWEVTRVIPPAALTGQAVGTAASMLIDDGISVSKIDIARLQEKLAADGVMIHF